MSDAYKTDAMDWTPEVVLDRAVERVRNGDLKDCDKCIVLFLDDRAGYNVTFMQSGMKCSEVITLLEYMKAIILREMLPPPD